MEDPLPSSKFIDGACILVDKPKDWTSFDVVNKIRSSLRYNLGIHKIKVGHAGTLDPMATGLLIICTGKLTKKLSLYQGQDKEYEGVITLGATTPSFDAETEPDAKFPFNHITPDLLEECRLKFIGNIEQVPPIYSALKVDGQPLYKMARKGIEVEVSPRSVTIHQFEITNADLPGIHFKIKCSKGTYIRSIAHDFGKMLGSGGYLSDLRRVAIGKFHIDNAWNLKDLVEHIESFVPLSNAK